MAAYSLSVKKLKQGVLRKCGEPVDGSSIYDQNGDALEFLNRAHLKVLSGGNEFVPELARPWVWAAAPLKFIVTLQPNFETGTVSVANGSNTITFSNPPSTSLAGYQFRVQGRPEWFKILAHIGGAGAATIDCNYTDTTAVGLSFNCVLLEYSVNPTNGVLRLMAPLIVYRIQSGEGNNEQKIYMSDESTMLKDYPMASLEQRVPTFFCVTTKDTSGVPVLRFNSYVLDQTKVEISYIPFPDPLLDTPTYPFFGTVTIASPGVWTKASHGLSNGDPVVLSTTGALPTGYVAGTTYYVVNQTANTFSLAATVGGLAINTSGAQSGTHTITPNQPATYATVPQDHVEILEYIAAHWLCEVKNDDRKDEYFQKATLAGKAMIGAYQKERTESSVNRGKLIPRQDTYWASRRFIVQEVTPGGP